MLTIIRVTLNQHFPAFGVKNSIQGKHKWTNTKQYQTNPTWNSKWNSCRKNVPSKHKTFVQHLYNVDFDIGLTLYKCHTKFCVCCVKGPPFSLKGEGGWSIIEINYFGRTLCEINKLLQELFARCRAGFNFSRDKNSSPPSPWILNGGPLTTWHFSKAKGN